MLRLPLAGHKRIHSNIKISDKYIVQVTYAVATA